MDYFKIAKQRYQELHDAVKKDGELLYKLGFIEGISLMLNNDKNLDKKENE